MYTNKAQVDTMYWNIHIAGDLAAAERFCTEYAFQKGWCTQIYPCKYIYTGGQESGIVARIISYPRFVKSFDIQNDEVVEFAKEMAKYLCQKSFTIENKNSTTYYESDNPLHGK
ncbi:hypothetical protein RaK2_00025 [Klebsiella phage vB_KleM_RaK2]|uniref:Uncharacterized protein n=1 Tax=Klebsiella phage vB_KleM_RaK2 TaxID=1147094 RepID=H6X3I2_9CAUD|nr:hypothetical protein F403_gp510 [Klebsiella phage vB_KleM_RaK2]AFA44298.1 hypothetical protein RaK2_00025 [Klebsiella phage vB_KleM_RaK2]